MQESAQPNTAALPSRRPASPIAMLALRQLHVADLLCFDSKKTRDSLTCKRGQKQARESGLSPHASPTCLDGLPVVTAATGLKGLDAANRAPNGISQSLHAAIVP